MSRFKVYPYKQGSRSAKTLATALDNRVLKMEGSRYRPRRGDMVINWGSGNCPAFGDATVLNPDVENARCKLKTFDVLGEAGVRCPDTWDYRPDDLTAEDFPIVCRTTTTGHSGRGIVIANNEDELVDAPLYVRYVKKQEEYRVHVLRDELIFIQRKARVRDHENPNWQVRNLEGGFVYVAIEAADVPQDVIDQSLMAVRALGLDFGGVDVIWNNHRQMAYVLEVNTACGLEERTAEHYANAFRNLVEGA